MKLKLRQPNWRFWAILGGLLVLQPLFGQSQWYDYYGNARESIADANWADAVAQLDRAIELRDSPKLEVETYSLRFIDYLPYFWRGVAQFNLGKIAAAQTDFARSEDWGVVNSSSYRNNFLRYRRLIESEISRTDSLVTLVRDWQNQQSQLENNRAQNQYLQQLSDALSQQQPAAAMTILADLVRENPGETQFTEWQRRIRQWQNESGNAATEAQLSIQFDEALQQYLAGNYAAALAAFAQIEQQQPGFRQANDWLRKTRSEMTRLGQKPDTLLRTVIERDTLGVAPVVAFPAEFVETRDAQIRITGVVRDDQGISHLTVSLNGSPMRDNSGSPLQIAPPDVQQKQGFRFAINVPLLLGENQLTVIATDVDSPPNQAAFPLTISRKQPLYREPMALSLAALVVLFAAGGVFANWYFRRRIAFVSKYNPYIAGAPVLNEKMFFGRENLLRQVLAALPNNSLMLHGPRRIGKTSLLHQLKKRLEQQPDADYVYLPVYIDLQGTPEMRFFATMAHDIVEGCAEKLPADVALRIAARPENYTARDFSADVRDILKSLQPPAGKPLILALLIDEVDELNRYSAQTNQKLRSIFMKTFAENLVSVMAGSHIRKRWESEGSPWYNFFSEIPVGQIERAAAEQLIREPVKSIFSFDDPAVSRILELSDCVPYRIQKICARCIARIIESRRRRVTVADVEAVAAAASDEG